MTLMNGFLMKKGFNLSAVKLEWATENIDKLVAWMARVSNPKATPDDPATKLIGYLIDHKHWSPFEMASICIAIQTTRDIGRQLLRHRSFHFQEFSQRYAEVNQYEPILSSARLQDTKNRQNSIISDDPYVIEQWEDAQIIAWEECRALYTKALDIGIAKEVARKLLPEGLTKTSMFMCGTVRDWYHYLDIRMGPETQLEHRELAKEIYDVCYAVAPDIFGRLKGDEVHWPRWGAAFGVVMDYLKHRGYGEFGKPTERDHHLGHANILTFMDEGGHLIRGDVFKDIDDHDESIINWHNELVDTSDRVYFLGDLVINKKYLYKLDRMNGRKVLVRGNHDIFKLKDYTPYFDDIRAYVVQKDGDGNKVIMSHIPIHPESLGRFGSNIHGHLHGNIVKTQEKDEPDKRYICVSLEHTNYRPIEASAEKYGIWRDGLNTYFPYYHPDGRTHLANKIRYPDKEFSVEGDLRHSGLFGQHLFPAGSAKFITIVEGEYDAPAAHELMGSRWPCVSVRNGADGATRDVADNFEYVNSFPTIVICFDKDEAKINEKTGQVRYPGQEAALAVAECFPSKGQGSYSCRSQDPNDYLKAGLREQFNREWWSAPGFTPSGLKLGREMWEEISEPKNYETVPYPWNGLNAQTYGIRLSELVVVTAETGVGKTSVLKEIEYYILKNTTKYGVGFLHLEEPNSDTALGLMSIEAGRPLHLPDIREAIPKDELRSYFDTVINNDRVVVWDHFGSNSIQEVLNKVRHMHNLGCKYIVLDHLSIVVSDQNGDERKQLDEISTKLKTLCMELGIAVIAVIHQNRQGQIRGTAGVEQLANIVLKLHRERLSEDPWRRNVTKVIVEKNRFCGRTGPGCYLHYNAFTGRLNELTEEQIKAYNAGGTADIEVWA
ncbi:unnamed protein product [Sphagnum jensenii]